METLTIGKLLTKHTTGLRITNNFVTLFTHYGNFIDEEIKDYPIDAISVEYECNDLARKGFKIVSPELSLVTKQVSFPFVEQPSSSYPSGNRSHSLSSFSLLR